MINTILNAINQLNMYDLKNYKSKKGNDGLSNKECETINGDGIILGGCEIVGGRVVVFCVSFVAIFMIVGIFMKSLKHYQ